jgi:hypothetical protein
VLDVPSADGGGSPWWRAISDTLLRDQIEADLLSDAPVAGASSRNVEFWRGETRGRVGDTAIGVHRPGLVTIRYTAAITSRSATVPTAASKRTRRKYSSDRATSPLPEASMSRSTIAWSRRSSGMK